MILTLQGFYPLLGHDSAPNITYSESHLIPKFAVVKRNIAGPRPQRGNLIYAAQRRDQAVLGLYPVAPHGLPKGVDSDICPT